MHAGSFPWLTGTLKKRGAIVDVISYTFPAKS